MEQKRDIDLVVLVRAGDKAAFGLLIERYEPMVKRLALTMVHHEYLAQELTQETLLQTYLSLQDLRDNERFKSWLYGITLNVCKSHPRSRKIDFLSVESLRGGMYIDSINTSLLSEATPDPQAVAEEQDLHGRILDAVNALSSKNRAATLLFYYDQLTLSEIAAILGVSVAAVKGRLHKSRKQLRGHLFSLYADMNQLVSTPERRHAMIEVTVADIAFKQNEDSDSPEYYPISDLVG